MTLTADVARISEESTLRTAPSVAIDRWQRVDPSREDPDSLLHAVLEINAIRFHVDAIAVTDAADGAQVAVDSQDEDDLTRIADGALTGSGRLATVEIDGRQYVIACTPFGA